MFIKNYGCIWLAPDFESRSIGDISSSLTMVRSPKYIDAYSPQMLSDIYTNFNEISIISSSLTMIANLFNLNQSVGGFTLKNKSVMWDVGPSKVIESTKQFTAL
jgi:hypothetical protein